MSDPKERPILFSAPMVRALLDGRKTQTRRVLRYQYVGTRLLGPEMYEPAVVRRDGEIEAGKPVFGVYDEHGEFGCVCPFRPGDRLWVRETWQYANWTEDGMPFIRYAADDAVRFVENGGGEDIVDVWAELSDPANYAIDNTAADRRWRPSIFMPRWASRLTLEITEVRAERLQDISEADAKAEGAAHFLTVRDDDTPPMTATAASHVDAFKWLWLTLHGAEAWDENPWLWVVTFHRVEQ